MRIAYVSDAIYPYNKGGKEKRLYELSTRLAAMGHDVHIYCMKWWDGAEQERTENGVHLHAISKLYPLYVKDRRSIKQGLLFGAACFRLMTRTFDTIDVDHMPFFPIFSTWIVCTLRHKKLYGTWHEALTRADWIDYMGVSGNIAAIIERISIRLPHTVTASSIQTFELISSELKRKKRLHLVPPGVDIEAIEQVSQTNTACDVLFVGRLVKDKNVAMLVEAISIVSKHNPKISAVIVGSGIEEKNIRKRIAHYKLQDTVRIINNLPHASDIYGLMKAARVFVLPSAREGFGIVVLEALACGTPVVTVNTKTNASKRLVINDDSGSVVALNAKALAEAIQKWLDRSPERSMISQSVSGYDWGVLARKQAEVYTQ